jgi:protein TonB
MTIPYDHQDSPAAANGIGRSLIARPISQDLRARLPSMALSLGAHVAAIALIGYLSIRVVMPAPEEQALTVSIAMAPQQSVPEPPPPVPMPDLPRTIAQIAPPQLDIASAPSPMAITAAPPQPPAPPQREEKIAEETPVSPPRFDAAYLNNPATVYPNMSRRLREVGTVQLRVRVSTAGLPLEILMAKSSGYPRLDDAALTALRKWKFQPASRAGQAIEAWVLVPVEFILTRS